MEYTVPPEGTLLPPQPNLKFQDPQVGATTADVLEWQQAYYQDLAWRNNAVKVQDYYNTRPSIVPPQTWVTVHYEGEMFINFDFMDKPGTEVCKHIPQPGR